MTESALITGITGQDGSYLAELLLDQGYEVHGMVRRASTEKFERLEHLRAKVTLHQGDLLRAEPPLDRGYEGHGMARRASTEKFERLEHLRDKVTLHQGDLLDQRSLVDTIKAAKPDEIYNLAAMSFVAVSWIQPTLTAEFTGVSVTRMLEAMREPCPHAPPQH